MFDSWTFKMAWRDSRGNRRQLLLFLSSMALGVAAFVAIQAFGVNLERAVDEQARELLGADLSIESRNAFTKETEALIDSLGGRQSRRVSFASMALFPRTGDTRLVTVRAIEGDYPYYGEVVTRPVDAARTYLEQGGALVDGTLMQQFELQVGDTVRVGEVGYPVVGSLERSPRENEAISLFSPRVYVPLASLDRTLLTTGSRVEYEVYFQFEEGRDIDALVASIEPHLERYNLGHDTVEEAKENWNEGLTNLYRFLSLVGFIAVLLGGIGVASAVHVYIKQRIDTVAVLRCLGASSRRTFAVYWVQAAALGLIGGGLGCLLGVGVQLLVPRVLADFLPVQVAFFVSWRALLLGLGIGLAATLLFALLPLLSVRRVSPLVALRASYEAGARRFDVARLAVFGLIAMAIIGFALVQAPNVPAGIGYAVGVLFVFGLLALVARLLMVTARRFFPTWWPYPWRQGLANLFRPNNQTLILMLALGLGTFLITTLLLTEHTLLSQIQISSGDGRPDVVLFDIQPDQIDGVTELVEAEGLPVLERVPIVTMRLSALKGEKIDDLEKDSTNNLTWAHRREYRSTYRSYVTDAETILEGTFVPRMPAAGGAAPISIEAEVAAELGVGLGDTLVWDVQGLPVESVVASIRRVDWQRLSTNFFVVFPEGVIDEAPQFYVLLSHAGDDAASASLQRSVVQAYPNVSAIDLSLVLGTFDAIFGRISFVIRFMALFSILTGLIVLIGAVVVSRMQRTGESVLLKTLGASRRQVVQIMVIEYLFLGVLATLTGLVLSLAGTWALARFVFEAPFTVDYAALVGALVVVTSVTVAIGMLNSRGTYDRPALAVLRAEG